MKRITTVCVVLIMTLCCFATDYYCSPTGKGNGSSYDQPGAFTAMLSKIGAGDVLYCLGGQYDYSSPIDINKVGTASKMVCIFNAPGETPVFDFRHEAYGQRGFVIKEGSQYVHIKGLAICYTGKNAIHNSGSNCIFENLDAYGNGDTGIQMKAGGNNLILNCDSHDNFDYELANDFGGNADGFADKQYTGGGNIYRGCRAWNNSDDGWDFYQRVSESGTVTILENCICYNNGPKEYDMRNHPRYETDKAWFDQFLGSGMQVTFRKSDTPVTVTLEHYLNNGNGNGFKLGGAYTNNVVRVVNSLAIANIERGFDQNNNNGTMEVYNCSAYANGSDYNFTSSGNGKLTIKNCLTLGGDHLFNCREYTDEYNSWNIAGITCDENDFQSLDISLVLTPRQADGSLTETPLMRLRENSDMIDAGVIIGYPFAGEAPDLGCYEYGQLVYPATLECKTNNLSQSIKEGEGIRDIIVKWGGEATGAIVENLPAGLTVDTDNDAQTLTISGTPAARGSYDFTIRTQQPEDIIEATLTCRIVVREDIGVEIAYVTVPGSGADEPVLNTLNEAFAVTVLDANSSSNSYADYDVVVISSVPGSNLAAMGPLKGVAKPVLLLKPWVMKNGVWNWGTAQNTSDAAMHITMADHPIFQDVTITDSQLTFFGTVSTNGVTYISQWNNASTYTEIARPLSANGQSIFELPAGGTYNGTTLSSPLLCVGLSEYSLATLTTEGQKVLSNVCYYLAGKPIPSGINHLPLSLDSRPSTIYNLTGQRVSNSYKGIVICNGKKLIRK